MPVMHKNKSLHLLGLLGQDGQAVGANFVGRVPVLGNPEHMVIW